MVWGMLINVVGDIIKRRLDDNIGRDVGCLNDEKIWIRNVCMLTYQNQIISEQFLYFNCIFGNGT